MFIQISSFFLSLVCLWALRALRKKGPPLPPGPAPLPVIGNLHQIPRKDAAKTYKEWAAEFGSVVYMNVLGREFVILNTLEAITDLFEKRSSLYSTRPRLVMAGELVGRDTTSVLFLKYGQFLKGCRRQIHEWLGPKPVQKLQPQLEATSNMLLVDLLDSPENLPDHIRTRVGTLILKLVYGIDCVKENDPYIAMSENVVKLMSAATTPGRWLVDSIPWLQNIPRWMPGTQFLEQAQTWRKACMNAITIPFELVTQNMEKATASPSWLVDAISKDKLHPLTPEEMRVIQISAGSIYTGGIDTTVTAIRTFFLMMARNRSVQKKAQAEIDAVIGSHRIPGLDDKPSLPYINRLITEILRINPTVPLVPHSLDRDDIYNGYRIPKGAWVMANMWLVFNDPERYEDPHIFNPDRYLDTPTHKAEMDPTLLAFSVGMGRRFCPGYHMAQSFIFIIVSQILSIFDIDPPKDENGVEMIPPADFEMGHISIPCEFKCTIRPRSHEKAKLVQDMAVALGYA